MKTVCRRLHSAFLAFLLLASASGAAFADAGVPPAAPKAEKSAEKPLKIQGDAVEYFYEKNRARGQGNIQIDYEGWVLTADSVEVDLKSKEAWAKGGVVLTQPGAKYSGEDIHVNFADKTAEVRELKAVIAPNYRGKAATLERTSGEAYLLRDAYITTCDESTDCADGSPQYRLESREIEYYPDDKLVMKHVILRLRNVPLFYIPVLVLPIEDFDRFPIQVELGTTSEWGAFALTKVRYYAGKHHDGNVLLDVRENQGFAWGVEHFYRLDEQFGEQFGRGALRTYFADDQCFESGADCSRAKDHTVPTASRYRIQDRHRAKIDDATSVTFELNKLSDEYMIQDYFYREEFERIAFPDNYVSVVRATDDYSASLLSRYRVDDFIPVVERLPEFNFDTHTRAIGNSNFYFRNQDQFVWLNRTYKDLDSEEANQDAGRGDVRNRLSYALKAGDVAITPFVGLRNTFYTRNLDGDERTFLRNNAEAGVDASTKLFKTYDASFHQWGIDIDQMRHILTPTVSYFYQSRPTYEKDELFQFDRLDTLDHESMMTVDLENKLQIKYRKDPSDPNSPTLMREFVRSIVSFEFTMPQWDTDKLHQILTETTFSPWTWLSVNFDSRYAAEFDRFEEANIDLEHERGPLKLGIGQRYLHEASNQTTAHVEWQAHRDWKFGVYERFDFVRDSISERGRNNEFELAIERSNFYCWTIRLIYNRSHDENGFFVTFTPSAFPENSFRRMQHYREVRNLAGQAPAPAETRA